MAATPIRKRQKRAVPAGDRSCRLTERDREVLQALGKMRFLTTRQITRLAFEGSRWAANKRCRKLLDAGLVRVWLRRLAEENIYSLTRVGGATAFEGDGARASAFVPRGLDGNLDHLLAINEVRLSFALGLAEGEGELLSWRSDWELRGGRRGGSVPDALFSVELDGTVRTFSLEVENAAKSPRKFLGKILRYRSAGARIGALYGVDKFSVLVVGRDDRSIERYRQSLACTPHGMSIWFTSLGDMADHGALGSIWRPVQGHERYSLRDH
jgi:hypothetical protein